MTVIHDEYFDAAPRRASFPLILGGGGAVALGLDTSKGTIIGRFDGVQASFRAAARAALNREIGGFRFKGTGSIMPVVIGSAGTIALGIDKASGAIIAKFDERQASFKGSVRRAVAPSATSLLRYTGTSTIRPISLFADGGIALGWDEAILAPAGALVNPVPRSQSIPLAEADRTPIGPNVILGVISYGQSLSVGADGGAVISSTQRWNNVKLNTGLRFGAGAPTNFVPLVEVLDGSGNGETPCTAAADAIVELAVRDSRKAPTDVVIFGAAPGQGSQTLAALSKSAGTGYYERLIDYVSKANALAMAAGKVFAVPVIMWTQGEADIDAGTTRTAYVAGMKQLRRDLDTDIKAITGQTCPVQIVMSQTVHNSMQPANAKNVQRAQFDLVRSEPYFHMGGPIYHLFGSTAGTGNIHMSSLGYALMARQYGRAAKQVIVDNHRAQFLEPLSALAEGNVVRLKFAVPQMPLVIDRVNMRLCKDNGIAIKDDAGTKVINAMEIEGGDTLKITFAGALGANPVIRGALDYAATGQPFINGSGTNLRDSSRDKVRLAGTTYPLWHRCPHFELPVTTLS